MLQCVAACCSALQHVAACCSVLQRVAVCCSVLQCVAVCCSVLRARGSKMQNVDLSTIATHCNTLQHAATCCNMLQHTAARYNTLQHTTTHLESEAHAEPSAALYPWKVPCVLSSTPYDAPEMPTTKASVSPPTANSPP